jgi:hypothetical protein
MRTKKRRGWRWGESDTHARTHSWRYTTRLYGVQYLKTVFLVTTVRLLTFHKLFILKVICWITLQWWVSKEPTEKKFYFGSFIWNVEQSYSEWHLSSWGFKSSGMWHCVTGWHSWHFEASWCIHLELLNPWRRRCDNSLKVRNHSLSDTELHPTQDLNAQQVCCENAHCRQFLL